MLKSLEMKHVFKVSMFIFAIDYYDIEYLSMFSTIYLDVLYEIKPGLLLHELFLHKLCRFTFVNIFSTVCNNVIICWL